MIAGWQRGVNLVLITRSEIKCFGKTPRQAAFGHKEEEASDMARGYGKVWFCCWFICVSPLPRCCFFKIDKTELWV